MFRGKNKHRSCGKHLGLQMTACCVYSKASHTCPCVCTGGGGSSGIMRLGLSRQSEAMRRVPWAGPVSIYFMEGGQNLAKNLRIAVLKLYGDHSRVMVITN
jgi:hypothetical protein